MNRHHAKRFYWIILWALVLSTALALIMYALRQNINVFTTPTELKKITQKKNTTLRLGGVVKQGSVLKSEKLNVQFTVRDASDEIVVRFHGVLPDLFREDKGVIAEGTLTQNGYFEATRVLAKHDENYMPKEVYNALRKKGSA